jgi:hypothetical protein
MKIYGRTIFFSDSEGRLFCIKEKISKEVYFRAYDEMRTSVDFMVVTDRSTSGFTIKNNNFRIMYYSYEI